MKKLLLILLLGLSLSAQSADKDIFETGSDLLKFCKQAADPAQRDPFTFGMCMGYLDGFISGYRFNKEVEGAPPLCNDIETRQRRAILKSVVDYLEQHPESRQELKSIALYRAMLDKMTCP